MNWQIFLSKGRFQGDRMGVSYEMQTFKQTLTLVRAYATSFCKNRYQPLICNIWKHQKGTPFFALLLNSNFWREAHICFKLTLFFWNLSQGRIWLLTIEFSRTKRWNYPLPLFSAKPRWLSMSQDKIQSTVDQAISDLELNGRFNLGLVARRVAKLSGSVFKLTPERTEIIKHWNVYGSTSWAAASELFSAFSGQIITTGKDQQT